MRSWSIVLAALLLAGCEVRSESPAPAPPPGDLPALTVDIVADGLDHPWDVVAAPDGTLLTGERGGRFVAIPPGGPPHEVRADLADLYVAGETGLMGLALATDFERSRIVFSCQGHLGQDGDTDIRVLRWTVDERWAELTGAGTVVDGLPVRTGRHGGCRLLPRPDGTLFVGTGDSAQPALPQSLDSLGGKVLRVDAATGRPATGNLAGPVFTLGHRNVQGLAVQPGTDRVYAVEHGPDRDDEVNLLQPGGNYGWRPDRRGGGVTDSGGYDESVPMTDPDRVPGAIAAVWSSGDSTLATSGAGFVRGAGWRAWDGSLAVAALKAQRLVLLRIADDGRSVTADATPPELDRSHGRLRSVTPLPDGSLLLTTDNGTDDAILRVRPA